MEKVALNTCVCPEVEEEEGQGYEGRGGGQVGLLEVEERSGEIGP